jgi:hypothetical protein
VGGVPAALEALVASCLAKERGQRPADMATVMAALGEIARAYPWTEADARAWWAAHREG